MISCKSWAEACCSCAMLRIVERRLRPCVFGSQWRQTLFSCACEGGQALPLLRSLVDLSLFYSPVYSTENHAAFSPPTPGNLTFQFLPICLHGASIKSNWLSQASFHAFALLLLSDLKNAQLCLTSALTRKILKDNSSCLCLAQVCMVYL